MFKNVNFDKLYDKKFEYKKLFCVIIVSTDMIVIIGRKGFQIDCNNLIVTCFFQVHIIQRYGSCSAKLMHE